MVAPSAALWKLSMDPLLGGVGSPQPAEVKQLYYSRDWRYTVDKLISRPIPSYPKYIRACIIMIIEICSVVNLALAQSTWKFPMLWNLAS